MTSLSLLGKLLQSALLFLLLLVLSCGEESGTTPEPDVESMAELEVDQDFVYSTTRAVNLQIFTSMNGDIPLQGVRFDVYNGDPEQAGVKLVSGATSAEGTFECDFSIPSYVGELYLVSTEGTEVISVTGPQLVHTVMVESL